MNSPFIVNYIEKFVYGGKVCIVSEYASGGTVKDLEDKKLI